MDKKVFGLEQMYFPISYKKKRIIKKMNNRKVNKIVTCIKTGKADNKTT
jgi:hypothetical protein